MVRAAWCECHEELGTSLDPELCSKERWNPTELFEMGSEIPVAGPRWPHSGNQTEHKSRNRFNHSL